MHLFLESLPFSGVDDSRDALAQRSGVSWWFDITIKIATYYCHRTTIWDTMLPDAMSVLSTRQHKQMTCNQFVILKVSWNDISVVLGIQWCDETNNKNNTKQGSACYFKSAEIAARGRVIFNCMRTFCNTAEHLQISQWIVYEHFSIACVHSVIQLNTFRDLYDSCMSICIWKALDKVIWDIFCSADGRTEGSAGHRTVLPRWTLNEGRDKIFFKKFMLSGTHV